MKIDKTFEISRKDKYLEVRVYSFLTGSELSDLKNEIRSGEMDVHFLYDKDIHPDFINLQFLLAVKKWQENKGKSLVIEGLNISKERHLMISGGNLLKQQD